MIRSFIAVELPDRFIPEIQKIETILKTQGIKLVEPKLIHITMKFLGDVNEDKITPIASALSQIDCRSFRADIKGVGVFPKMSYIKVIWLGAHGDFDTLHKEIERVLLPFKFEKDYNFKPHATLARVKDLRDKAELIEKIKKIQDIDIGTIMVASISLKKSTLTSAGPVYETLHKIKLKT